MEVCCFFPIFEEDDSKKFFEGFLKSNFFKKNYEILTVCYEKDKKNLNYLNSLSIKRPNFKVVVLKEKFSYNDAFSACLNEIKTDILLLGDSKISKIEILFEKLLEKQSKKINIVHVAKRKKGIKKFFFNLGKGIYNFFIKLFSGHKDKLNLISVGLIDKDALDLFKVLPGKCCFLKNVCCLPGFEIRTVYIDDEIKTYKPDYRKKTGSLISTIISASLIFFLTMLLIFLNIFIESNIQVYNIIMGFVILLALISGGISTPKHFFDIRNRENKNIKILTKSKGDKNA